MAWNFRKRVKIAPGVKLNFSKSGTSVTVGGKGASVNIGKKGVYGNLSIPGTGIYSREKISGSNKKQRVYKPIMTKAPLAEYQPPTAEEPDTKEAVIGLLSVLAFLIAGVIVGFKFNPYMGVGVACIPFLYLIIQHSGKDTQ